MLDFSCRCVQAKHIFIRNHLKSYVYVLIYLYSYSNIVIHKLCNRAIDKDIDVDILIDIHIDIDIDIDKNVEDRYRYTDIGTDTEDIDICIETQI